MRTVKGAATVQFGTDRSAKSISMMRTVREAFTLTEVLVVIAVITALFAIMLPAVQSARESARLSHCSNNLRQLAMGVLQYESRRSEFPPAYTEPDIKDPDRPKHNLIPFLLADIEQTALAENYSFEFNWFESLRPTPELSNRRISEARIDVVGCPSTPDSGVPGVADYSVCTRMDGGNNSSLDGNRRPARKRLLEKNLISPRSRWYSVLAPFHLVSGEFRPNTRNNVTDGLSQSMMLFEDAGRPELHIAGTRIYGSGSEPVTGASWADAEAPYSVHDLCGDSMMNCNNDNEIYSFHRSGCNFAFGDGSVHFLSQDIDPEVFVSLMTCNADDLVKEIP